MIGTVSCGTASRFLLLSLVSCRFHIRTAYGFAGDMLLAPARIALPHRPLHKSRNNPSPHYFCCHLIKSVNKVQFCSFLFAVIFISGGDGCYTDKDAAVTTMPIIGRISASSPTIIFDIHVVGT